MNGKRIAKSRHGVEKTINARGRAAGQRTQDMVARKIANRINRFHILHQLGACDFRKLFEISQPLMREGKANRDGSGAIRNEVLAADSGNTVESRFTRNIVHDPANRE